MIRELSLAPGQEWAPRFRGWSLIQVGSGTGYFLQSKINQELESGMALLLAAEAQGNIRASQLGGLSLFFVPVELERLTGLITLDEQINFETAAFREKHSAKVFPPQNPVAAKMKVLCADRLRSGSPFRLQLIQLFFEAFGNELKPEAPKSLEAVPDAKERLQEFLKQTPAADLLDLDFSGFGADDALHAAASQPDLSRGGGRVISRPAHRVAIGTGPGIAGDHGVQGGGCGHGKRLPIVEPLQPHVHAPFPGMSPWPPMASEPTKQQSHPGAPPAEGRLDFNPG